MSASWLELSPVSSVLLTFIALIMLCAWPLITWLLALNIWPRWFDPSQRKRVRLPLLLLVWLMLGRWAASLLASSELLIYPGWIITTLKLLNLFTFAWVAITLISIFIRFLLSRKSSNRQWETSIKGFEKLSTFIILSLLFLSSLKTLGYSISSVLALSGIAGIAVSLAAKDVLSNILGGLFLYFDRPFAVGDWISSPDRNIEGTVEKLGIRQTKIRTFDKRPLYVPNAIFSNIIVENPTRMTNRRIYETFGVRYEDAQRIEPILEDIRAWLANNDLIDQKSLTMVHLDQFAPSSLDCFVYTFTKTRDWQEYHVIKQQVLLNILSIIEKHGASCAFPTRTLEWGTVHSPNPAVSTPLNR